MNNEKAKLLDFCENDPNPGFRGQEVMWRLVLDLGYRYADVLGEVQERQDMRRARRGQHGVVA